MRWSASELETLQPVLDRVVGALQPVAGCHILVLCSARGELAERLGQMGAGEVVGLEYDDDMLFESIGRTGPQLNIDVFKAELRSIPFPTGYFDAVVSDLVLFPTCKPTQIGTPELARVLKPGGPAVLTDVVVTSPLDEWAADELRAVGFDYSCNATFDDYDLWLSMAGLRERRVHDLTPLVEPAWRARAEASERSRVGYELLLDDPKRQLGHRIFYLLATGRKPVEAGVAV
jgi:SAM-dependent methyltransferase